MKIYKAFSIKLYYIVHYFKKLLEGKSLRQVVGKDNLREKRLEGGAKNPDKKFLIIVLRGGYEEGPGFFKYWKLILGYIKQADERGMIPIIDMKSWRTSIADKAFSDEINLWELYYKQYNNYSLDEVYDSKNIYLCEEFVPSDFATPRMDIMLKRKDLKVYHRLIDKYLILNEAIQEELDKKRNLLPVGKRILGVAVRGSSFLTDKPLAHSIQPTFEEIISAVTKRMVDWNCDVLFLATEDQNAVRAFKEAFGDKLYYYERVRNYSEGIEINKEDDMPRDKTDKYGRYHTNIDYLCEVYTLASCECLIGSIVNGTMAAVAINGGKYENMYIFDRGSF